MKKKLINLRGLKEVLSEKELKSVLGGSGGNNDKTLDGVRCYQGQCYCDYVYSDGSEDCDVACDMAECSSMGCSC